MSSSALPANEGSESQENKSIFQRHGWRFIFIGLIMIVAAIGLERYFLTSHPVTIKIEQVVKENTEGVTEKFFIAEPVAPEHSLLLSILIILIKLFEHFGVAFISIGIIGILMEMREWRDYFQERIVNTIVRQDYLEKMGVDERKKLMGTILELKHKIKGIRKAGSIFNFFYTKIDTLVATPYREDTQMFMKITGDGEFYNVTEITSYTCRQIGDRIQEKITWQAEKHEIGQLSAFKFILKVPHKISNKVLRERYPSTIQREKTFDMADDPLHPSMKRYGEGHGYILALGVYREIDELCVEVQATYTVPVGRTFPWTMPDPSKSLSGEIQYPKGLVISVDRFGIDQKFFKPEETPSNGEFKVYKFSYKSWVLPDNGLAFYFREEPDPKPPQ